MKTVYIPKGETVHYESLVTDHLVVKGCLDVTYLTAACTMPIWASLWPARRSRMRFWQMPLNMPCAW